MTAAINVQIHMTRPEDAEVVEVQDFTHPGEPRVNPFVSVKLGDVSIYVRDLTTLHAIQEAFIEAGRLMFASEAERRRQRHFVNIP